MFGEILKELRLSKNLTQAELGALIGVTQKAITKYENDKAELSYNSLLQLSDFFGVSIDYILGKEDDYGIKKYEGQTSGLVLSDKEKEILNLFRELTEIEQDKLIADADFYAKRNSGRNKKNA